MPSEFLERAPFLCLQKSGQEGDEQDRDDSTENEEDGNDEGVREAIPSDDNLAIGDGSLNCGPVTSGRAPKHAKHVKASQANDARVKVSPMAGTQQRNGGAWIDSGGNDMATFDVSTSLTKHAPPPPPGKRPRRRACEWGRQLPRG